MVFNTLSGRFLGLTILFVMIAEVLIFVPSVSRFRVDYLQNRLEMGQLAALPLLTAPDMPVAPDLQAELLATADVLNVVLRRDDVRELALPGPVPAPVAQTFDLRSDDQMKLMRDALRVFVSDQDRIIRVIGRTPGAAERGRGDTARMAASAGDGGARPADPSHFARRYRWRLRRCCFWRCSG